MELKGPKTSVGPRVGAPSTVNKYKGPLSTGPRADMAPPEEEPFDPLRLIEETLRNFNDSLTFGLYDKALEATGIQPDASRRTAESNPGARIVGQTLGGIPGGMGVERALMEAVPWMARNTIPSIAARSATSNAVMSGADDWVRDQELDPLGILADAAIGGGLGAGTSMVSRYLSPGARVRAKGNDLTPADKEAATGYAANAADRGIMLDSVEALNRVAPERSADVAALKNSSLQSPAASQVKAQFDAVRAPGVREAGKKVVQDLGGNRSPFDVQMAAQGALDSVEGGFNATASVPLGNAAKKRIPPSHLPRNEAYGKAAADVMNDPVAMEALDDPAENSIAFLDEVRQNAARRSDKTNSPSASNAYKATEIKLDELLRKAGDRAGYSEGRAIQDQGRAALAELEGGPLGKIARSGSSSTQSGALFGVTNGAEATAAKEAADYIPPMLSKGLLANALDSAASKSKSGSIREALPNEHAAGVAAKVAGDDEINNVIDMLRQIDDKNIPVHMEDDRTGVFGQVWNAIRNYGRDGVIKRLNDPEWVKKMGGIGPVQKAVEQILLSTERETTTDDNLNYMEVPLY